ncbi:glycoside hydrolase family 2 protein [Wenxinia saemankumensis]|uniref:Glycosyl hydrolases family 2, TIM barrel domain n=1 Tax=Wenxinia saemankumensis TaxID=1447782 RepID=A0A1M5ZY40_9RHOB|nr:sugar-binding domain-containing protein [Wenxinia saemankumensis]SHI29197.1 Glycosyl hydrolases family 2, TIM barrel domain [Wenxinia saemankumensis]
MTKHELAERHPHPRMARERWIDLSGPWDFRHDDADEGLDAGWGAGEIAGTRPIVVPYPPESEASGIGDPGFHPVLWYRRDFVRPEMAPGERLVLRFGAVDHAARVWVNGTLVATHEGGHTPFEADVTAALVGAGPQTITVRAEDPPEENRIPRGKQDWQEEPHGIWYNRTSGIWQPVWATILPAVHMTDMHLVPSLARANLRCEIRLNRRPATALPVRVRISTDGRVLADTTVMVDEAEAEFDVAVPAFAHSTRRERMVWSPEHPRLLDAEVSAGDDRIETYVGFRTVGTEAGRFTLNERPTFLRMVLGQNYWPKSHLAASGEELRREVELIKALGFNGVRIHQKIEDPRFLYWCDRIGVMVWEEMPSAYVFSNSAVERLSREWTEAIRRDKGHPCIVAWVPFNESWGVSEISRRPDQAAYTRALYHLTKALDPSRPVISNDGWELTETDIVSIHDYAPRGAGLTARYGDAGALEDLLRGFGAPGRRLLLDEAAAGDRPVMLTEFGGLSFTPDAGDHWVGYATVPDEAAFEARLVEWFDAIAAMPLLQGYCYTQLTDTMQEVNGLLTEDREPKLPIAALRRILTAPAAAIPGEEVDLERRAALERTGRAG